VASVQNLEAGDPAELADALAARFRDLHGRAPYGVYTAPGRVNLIGEHVDYNGGLCLPMALPHSTYAAIARRDDDRVSVVSAQEEDAFDGRIGDLGPDRIDGWAAYAAGVLWAMREDGWELPGVDVVVDGHVPLGAGLSSSAALECSVALAAADLAGGDITDHETLQRLVRACMRAEREVAGAPTGGMDQTVSVLAQEASALLLDCRDWSTRLVPWDPQSVGLDLLVVDTKAAHSLGDGGYAARREDCDRAAEILGVELLRDVQDQGAALQALDDERLRRRVRHVFSEIDRVGRAVEELQDGDYDSLGATFLQSHESLRDDYEVSCEELDAVVEVSVAQGALGARMTGGGFGGSAIVLVRSADVPAVRAAIESTYDERGWDEPAFLTAPPSAGARRLR
jgi:galactokinase